MMKHFFVFTLGLLLMKGSFAQDEPVTERGFKKENVFVGGNFGLAFGNYTLINVSPQVGYRFNKTLAAGMGLNLLYVSSKETAWSSANNAYYQYKQVQGITGLNLFGRIYPVQNFMIQLQPELNYRFGYIKYLDGRDPQKTSLDAEIVPSLLAGGGLVMPGPAGAFMITVMYDLMQNENSPYGSKPVVNVGYNINLGR